MHVTAHPSVTVAWCGFSLGLLFGAVGNKVNLCTMGAGSDVVNRRRQSQVARGLCFPRRNRLPLPDKATMAAGGFAV